MCKADREVRPAYIFSIKPIIYTVLSFSWYDCTLACSRTTVFCKHVLQKPCNFFYATLYKLTEGQSQLTLTFISNPKHKLYK